jgi:hypothetical protein
VFEVSALACAKNITQSQCGKRGKS